MANATQRKRVQNPAFYRDCDEQKAYLGKECLGADSFNVEANNRVVLGESYGIFVDQILGYQVISRKYPFLFGKTVILWCITVGAHAYNKGISV